MKVFLSWSTAPSHAAAKLFHDWLPDVLQAVRPWLSSEDISSGAGWNQMIRSNLEDCDFGILFITRENCAAPWIMFEAGALAKRVNESRVVPFVVDPELQMEALPGPLRQLQARRFEETSVRKLVLEMNSLLPADVQLTAERLRRCFDTNWPWLRDGFENLPKAAGELPKVEDSDLLRQILSTVTAIQRGSKANSGELTRKVWRSQRSEIEKRFQSQLNFLDQEFGIGEDARRDLTAALSMLDLIDESPKAIQLDTKAGPLLASVTGDGKIRILMSPKVPDQNPNSFDDI